MKRFNMCSIQKKYNFIIAALLLVFALIFFSSVGESELAGSDEPRYAQIAREMIETGQYILPHKNAEIYPDKPPVLFWLISLASLPSGDVTAFTARFPSALAGLVLIILTYLFAKKLYDPFAGLLAACILFTTKEFFDLSVTAHFDVLFACGTTLALLLFYHGYTTVSGAKKYYLLSYCSMGCALLTKGPVGVLIPLITIFLFLCTKKELWKIRKIHLGKGLLIALGILAIWLIPACLLGGKEYTDNIIFKQNFGRTVESFSHKAPFYYYLYDFPLKSIPWSIFIPSVCIYFWQNRKKDLNIVFPLLWFAGTFAFFSAMSCKRSLYLLHLYPAFSLLLAKFSSDAFARANAMQEKLYKIPLLLLFCIFLLGGGGGLIVLAGNFSIAATIAPVKIVFYPVGILAFCGGCLGLCFLWRRKSLQHSGYLLGILLLIAYFFMAATITPAVNSIKPGKEFCENAKKLIGPDDILIASFEPDYFNYMLHRYPIPVIHDDAAALEKIFLSPKKVFYIAKDSEYDKAPAAIKQLVTIIDEAEIGRRSVVLLGNTAARNATKHMPNTPQNTH
jgi:4-amino-4-deoxy-L-arabinose transferase-like glycosyltransferase